MARQIHPLNHLKYKILKDKSGVSVFFLSVLIAGGILALIPLWMGPAMNTSMELKKAKLLVQSQSALEESAQAFVQLQQVGGMGASCPNGYEPRKVKPPSGGQPYFMCFPQNGLCAGDLCLDTSNEGLKAQYKRPQDTWVSRKMKNIAFFWEQLRETPVPSIEPVSVINTAYAQDRKFYIPDTPTGASTNVSLQAILCPDAVDGVPCRDCEQTIHNDSAGGGMLAQCLRMRVCARVNGGCDVNNDLEWISQRIAFPRNP